MFVRLDLQGDRYSCDSPCMNLAIYPSIADRLLLSDLHETPPPRTHTHTHTIPPNMTSHQRKSCNVCNVPSTNCSACINESRVVATSEGSDGEAEAEANLEAGVGKKKTKSTGNAFDDLDSLVVRPQRRAFFRFHFPQIAPSLSLSLPLSLSLSLSLCSCVVFGALRVSIYAHCTCLLLYVRSPDRKSVV